MPDHDREGLLRPMHSHSAAPRSLAGVDPSTIPPIGPRPVNWIRSRGLHRSPLLGGPSDGALRPR
jgi:hypothetical protein